MLSRVAENLYWISRYIERAENIARMLDASFRLELDTIAANGAESPIESLLTILSCRDEFLRRAASGPRDRDAVLRFLTLDRSHNHSILAMVGKARENARATQEALGVEAWSQINRLYLYLLRPRAARRFRSSPSRFLESLTRACILFVGLIETTLPRTEAYHFLQLGRYLERASQVARLLSVRAPGDSPTDLAKWSSLLQTCSATEAYLRQNQERIDPVSVVRYLVLEPEFPRTLRFCIARCCESLHAIAGQTGRAEALTEVERRLGRLDSELCYLDVTEIFGQGLSRFLFDVQIACGAIGTEVHHAYFFS